MNEFEARDWLALRWGKDKLDKLERFVELLLTEAAVQNLVSRSTLATIWTRHIVDSAQLIELGDARGTWVDVGSGGGLPGLVVAILREQTAIMVEPRRLRVDFLNRVVDRLDIRNVSVVQAMAEKCPQLSAAVISARAVAPLPGLLHLQTIHGDSDTIGVYPRGRGAEAELEQVRQRWSGAFHVEHSVTDADAKIVVARGIGLR